MIIYKIVNKLNNKVYIGQTTGKLQKRLNNHFSYNRKETQKTIIGSAIKKYGKENFDVSVIFSAFNLDGLNFMETYFINFYNSLHPNGYNILTGGNNSKRTPEHCKKISESKLGKPLLKLRNKPKSVEHKNKLRLAKLGKKQTPEHIKNAASTRINKRLKKILIINQETKIEFCVKGIKFLKELGFDRSLVYRCLDKEKTYKKHKFKRVS